MCKSKLIRTGLMRPLRTTALVVLSAIVLGGQSAPAQVVSDCINEVASGTTVHPLTAHVGDTITVDLVNAGTSAGDCDLAGVQAWLVKPDNTSQLVFTNGFLPSGSCFRCPLNTAVCLGTGNCIPGVSFTYVVRQADVGQPLTFSTPLGANLTLAGIPNKVQFMPVAEGIVPAGGNKSGLSAAGRGQAAVLIIHPCIQVTKRCAYPDGQTCFLFGQPIAFSGVVTNCGDTTLFNIRLTDNPSATITFGTTTSLGSTYNGSLASGDSISFTGSYAPTGNGCGPQRDTIQAVGTDVTGLSLTNTATASCDVCNNPCIGVTKVCGPATVDLGLASSYMVSGLVTNCGNVPLTNVVVTDTVTNASGGVSTSTILTIASLPVGASSNIPPQTITVAGCGPSSDFFSASGASPCGGTVNAHSRVCTTTFTNTPCMAVVKVCGPATAAQGVAYTVSGYVTNCGTAPLTGVVVVDVVTGPNGTRVTNAVPVGSTTIAAGAALALGPISITPTQCGAYQDFFVATANGLCSNPAPQSSQVCTTVVPCLPNICITKAVACAPATGIAGCDASLPYAPSAIGAAGTNQSGFCYRIVVSNCGSLTLTNVTVNDTLIPDVASRFGTLTLTPGQAVTNFFGQSYPLGAGGSPSTNVNTVTATGTGPGTATTPGVTTNATASATAIVLPIGVSCSVTLSDSFVVPPQAPCQATLASNGPITFTLTVTNTGQADLDVALTGVPLLTNCGTLEPITVPAVITLPVGGSSNITGCAYVTCPVTTFNVSVQGTARATASTGIECVHDAQGNAIETAVSSCSACANCVTPVTCRTTGGGTLNATNVDQSCIQVVTTLFPPTSATGQLLVNVTHGGQLGAPYAHQDCGEVLGNPCIRGQWQHVRHYQGQGNPRDVVTAFHTVTPKGQFDSLTCACLPCCPVGDTNQPNGNFFGWTNLQFTLCNKDDHRICGPEPRPAPANALIWSGLGQLAQASDTGSAPGEWVVIRVYIEDRSEPGGNHPLGAIEPADIYVFQAWRTGIAVTKKPDFSTIATAFRTALAQDSCAFINSLSSGALPIGSLPATSVSGVAADIVDQGPLYNGNRQIHPSTDATCP